MTGVAADRRPGLTSDRPVPIQVIGRDWPDWVSTLVADGQVLHCYVTCCPVRMRVSRRKQGISVTFPAELDSVEVARHS